MKIKDVQDMNITTNNFIAEPLLIPSANKTNSNRMVMFCSHISQTPVLANNDGCEFPLVFTRFENQIGKYSSGYKNVDKDYTIIKKFERNKNYYHLLVQDNEGNYDILSREEVFWLTEKYGYKFNNYLDNYEIGETIEEGSVIAANTSYDENMNLCYGKNLRAMFYAYFDKTHEDAICISKSAAEKMTYNSVSVCHVNVNINDILLNLYGDENTYKPFPDIGEEIKDQELVARRRIIYDRLLVDLKNLTEVEQDDDVFYLNGKVVDIKVYCNAEKDKLRELPYYEQILKYIDNDYNYYNEVIDYLYDLVENNTELCSNDLIMFYNDCKKRLDKGNYYTYQANKFDNVMIEFTVLEEKHLKKGSKLTGRYGLY